MPRLRSIAPAKALRSFVSTYLFLESGDGQHVPFAPPQLSSGIAFFWGEGQIRYQSHQIDLPPNYIVPVTEVPFQATGATASKVVAVKFHPGRFFDFFHWPQDLFVGTTVPLVDSDLGKTADLLHEALDDQPSPQAQAKVLDHFLIRRLPSGSVGNPLISQVLYQFYQQPHWQDFKETPFRSMVSARHLRRLFRHYTGFSPRSFMRLLRFYRLYFRLLSGQPLSLTQAALEAGFYDQAHGIREFKRYTGLTPGAFLRHSDTSGQALAWEGLVG